MAEKMKFGDGAFEVHLPPELIAAELKLNPVELPRRTTAEHIRWALDHPIDSAPLKQLVRPGETVCMIISDVTRRWQSPETYIPILVAELEEAGVRDEDMLIVSATGAHRRQTREEQIGLVTEEVHSRIRFLDHQSCEEENLVYLGTTSYGTPVRVNRQVLECDKIILTGGVVYHPLAGYGGGRKSILPGVAGDETITKNHNLALNPGWGSGSNPAVRCANMDASNPIHADMVEACSMVNPHFMVNVVVDDHQDVIAAFAGNWLTAHRAACDLVDRIYSVPVREKTPLVIASAGGYPKDINLYQTFKTLCNVMEVVEDGGTIILVSECREGYGDEETRLQITGYATMAEREQALRERFTVGGYDGYYFAECAETHHIIVVTKMDQADFGTAKLHAVRTLDEALELSRRLNGGKDLRATLMPQGTNTLPRFV